MVGLRRKSSCKFSVSHGFSVRDRAKRFPYRELKGRSAETHRREKVRLSALKIELQPTPGLRKDRKLPFQIGSRQRPREKALPFQPKSSQSFPVRRKRE